MPDYNIKNKIDEKLGSEINYVTQVDQFLNDLITLKYIDPKYTSSSEKLIICRDWNSYYPSFYNVKGGCYAIYHNQKYTIIDPGYRTIQSLLENNIDTRLIGNVIITHDHEDHIGGLKELLDLLFTQSKGTSEKYTLYLNPGALNEYKDFSNDNNNLEVKEIDLEKEIILEQNNLLLEKFSFTAYSVHHTCINKNQKPIGLIFDLTKKGESLKFGITSDLDGKDEYIEEYKKVFNNLYFLIVHLGSLKYKKVNERKDKHLYPDGLFRLIESLDNVKAFIIQEFGLEIASPIELANILSSFVFHNGFFFPYIFYSLSMQKETEEIKNKLIPQLLTRFFESFSKNLKEKVIHFSCALCLDIDKCDFDGIKNCILKVDFFNVWNNNDLDKSTLLEISSLFDNFWRDLRKCIYYHELEIKDFEELCEKINKILNVKNFCKIIIKNSEKLLSFCFSDIKDKLFELLEIFFYREKIVEESFYPYSFIDSKIYMNFILHLSRYPLDNKFPFSYTLSNIQKKLLLLPFLIFIYVLNRFNNFKPNNSYEIQNKILDEFKEFFPKKEIYLGTYGKVIDFKTYYDPFENQRIRGDCKDCDFKSNCKIPRDGKNLFKNFQDCLKTEDLNLGDNSYQDLEEPELPELTIDERIRQDISLEIIEKIKMFNYNVFKCFLSKGDFNNAKNVLLLRNMRDSLEFNQEFFDYLQPNLNFDDVKSILLLFFKSPPNLEILKENKKAYKKLYETIHDIIKEEILNKSIKFLEEILIKFDFLLKHKLSFIFSQQEVHELKQKLTEILQTILRFLLSKREFSTEWAKNFENIAKIFAAIYDEDILNKLRPILKDDFNFDFNNKGKQYRYLKYLFEFISDPILIAIFDEKYKYR